MTKAKQLKLIRQAYDALYFLDNKTFTPYRQRLFDMIKKDEKQHRKGKPDGIPCGISVNDAVKLFVVRRIAECLEGQKYQVKDFLSIQTNCYYAQALVENYNNEILEAWEGLIIIKILALDYSELMKG